MNIDGVLETALYVEDVERAQRFYQQLFGFEELLRDERMAALRVGRQVLLLFKKGGTTDGSEVPGGFIPSHNGNGQLHLAFAVAENEIAAWKEKLEADDVKIISEVHPPQGGASLYFRDPDGNLVELATPKIWDMDSQP